jgi:hypothetical protein
VASLAAAEVIAEQKEWTAVYQDMEMYTRYFDNYYVKVWLIVHYLSHLYT